MIQERVLRVLRILSVFIVLGTLIFRFFVIDRQNAEAQFCLDIFPLEDIISAGNRCGFTTGGADNCFLGSSYNQECFLTEMGAKNTTEGGKESYCRLTINSEGNWILSGDAQGGDDQIWCSAACIKWNEP